MKKIIIAGLVFFSPLIFTANAMATNYECDTKQVNVWRGDKIVPPKFNTGVRPVILFNDETGNFSISEYPHSGPFDPIPFKILTKIEHQKVNLGYMLFAVGVPDKDSDANAGSFLRLRLARNDPKVVFMLSLASSDTLLTGECRAYDKIPPIMSTK